MVSTSVTCKSIVAKRTARDASYVQRVGRAGRGKDKKSVCVTVLPPHEIRRGCVARTGAVDERRDSTANGVSKKPASSPTSFQRGGVRPLSACEVVR